MPDIAQITNVQLLVELQNSFIDPGQKKELAGLIPEMTVEERNELMTIIKQSHVEAEKAGLASQDKLRELNAKYEEKLNNLVKESTEFAYKDFEEAEEKEEEVQLKAVEGELMTIDTSALHAPVKSKKRAKKSHAFRNIFFILFILLILAGAALSSIYYLSNM